MARVVPEPVLSVVIPTFNEAPNIGPLLVALDKALGSVPVEYIVVDDDSKDGTAQAAVLASERARVFVRKGARGLATAVVFGLRRARGDFVVVMDADFQHPPEAVVRLLEAAYRDKADLVVGSRFVAGGSAGNFGPLRSVISWGASTIGRLALPPIRKFGLTDPMSGLFLVRRAAVDVHQLHPSGYKILLEILGRMPLRRVSEVPFTFQDRRSGESKLGATVIVQYLQHLVALAWTHPENRRMAKFGVVGLSGVLVNLGLLWLLHGEFGLHDLVAVPLAVEASILSNFLLNDRFTFHDRRHDHVAQRLLKFNTVSILALVVNTAVYTGLTRGFGMHYLIAEAIAIIIAFGANYTGNRHWTYGGEEGFRLRDAAAKTLPWVPFVLLVGVASFVYFDDIDRVDEIYFDEHYYISVARQIDNGIWEDPCWVNDQDLPHRPLNYEHPPLAKLILAWSVMRFDTEHSVFEGCRNPDDTSNLSTACHLIEHDQVLSEHYSGKACYDAFTQRARTLGNPIAWRAPSALFGVATVTFAALAARRIFNNDLAGLATGVLVLLDGMVYSSARIALLDIFATGFAVAAIWAATFPTKKGILGAALLLGLGFACKYTVLFVGPPILLLALWTHARAGRLTRRRFDMALASYALVPVLVWITTYLPWWRMWIPERGLAWSVKHWLHIQGAAAKWGATGYQTHPYASQPAEWIPLFRPTFYYHAWGIDGITGREAFIYALGNPVVWWLTSAAIVTALGMWAIWVLAGIGSQGGLWASMRAVPFIVQALAVAAIVPAVGYGAFFALSRVTFLFYMTLLVPFMAIPLGGGLGWLWRRSWWGPNIVAVTLALTLAGFLWYYPVLSAQPVGVDRYLEIMRLVPWMGYANPNYNP